MPKFRGSFFSTDLRNAAATRSRASSQVADRCEPFSRTSGLVKRAVIDLGIGPQMHVKKIVTLLIWNPLPGPRRGQSPVHALRADRAKSSNKPPSFVARGLRRGCTTSGRGLNRRRRSLTFFAPFDGLSCSRCLPSASLPPDLLIPVSRMHPSHRGDKPVDRQSDHDTSNGGVSICQRDAAILLILTNGKARVETTRHRNRA
jgi:hypothetical protein